MYDPGRRGKKRDLRKGLCGDNGFSPHRFFDKVHGYGPGLWFGSLKGCDCSSWDECHNHEKEFIRHWTGCDYWDCWGHDHAPADYRRMLNRIHRAKCKDSLRRAIRDWDWDDYLPPRGAESADWSWF